MRGRLMISCHLRHPEAGQGIGVRPGGRLTRGAYGHAVMGPAVAHQAVKRAHAQATSVSCEAKVNYRLGESDLGGKVGTSRVAVIGAGYVGLATAAALAHFGHTVKCADEDKRKVAHLSSARVDILEPGLADLVSDGLRRGRLGFTDAAHVAVCGSEFTFLCVPTPTSLGGAPDLSAVDAVVDELCEILPAGGVLVLKSTVPVGTTTAVATRINREDVSVVANPEFLREGHVVEDVLRPDRIVVGSTDLAAAQRVAALYAETIAPVVSTDPNTAEVIKYAANSFLAVKLSFINSIAELCTVVGADVGDVAAGMGHDPRIGPDYLRPGPGWGGSCLPKDTAALAWCAEQAGVGLPILRAAIEANHRRQEIIVEQIKHSAGGSLCGARVGLLGLSFKAGTNDLRESPALAIAAFLAQEGAEVMGYDPGIDPTTSVPGVLLVADDSYQAVKGVDVIVLATEWPQFRDLDWARIAELSVGAVVIDTRHHLNPADLERAGLVYIRS
jgi:UDPglucose 6-dehydrogenase